MNVGAIYRVSTDRQVRRDGEETIPVQREAVRRFIAARPGWHLVREYAEAGVSGYKVSAADRDMLQQALRDARAGLWQVLVVFKADRLSRNALEYPLVIDRFRRLGCEVWSVADAAGGRLLALDSQMDKFIRFLEGWQAETESQNTSIRVSEAMRQLAGQGRWSGGPPPYGFRLNPARRPRSGVPALIIDPEQAAAIRLMVDLYLEERMGCKLIAGELNRRGVPHPGGRPWDDIRVRRTLQNPIIAGLPAYNRTRPVGSARVRLSPYDLDQFILPRDERGELRPVPAYAIIPLDRWLRLLRAMASQTARRRGGQAHGSPAADPSHSLSAGARTAGGVLTGLLCCGHCGARLSAGSTRYRQPRRDGTAGISRRAFYACQTHLHRGKQFCAGQRTHGRKRVESAVMGQLQRLLSRMDAADLPARLRQQAAGGLAEAQQRKQRAEQELRRAEHALAGWIHRLEAFMADPAGSPFSAEILHERIRAARDRRDDQRARLAALSQPVPAETDDQGRLPAAAPDWWTCFAGAAPVEQKLLLREILDRVLVRRGEIEIVFRVGLGEFLAGAPHPYRRV